MKSVAVFFGGDSVEREVSVITGVTTANAVDSSRYAVIAVYVDKNGVWYVGESLLDLDFYKNFDYKRVKKVTFCSGDNTLYFVKNGRLKRCVEISIAINCMHGDLGENGSFSGLLACHNIALASPSVLPSSISMDKSFTKSVLKGIGVKTLPSILVENGKSVRAKITYPVIVKPNSLGSSVGVSLANDKEQLKKALTYAFKYDDKVVIEEFLSGGVEINCAVFKDEKGEVIVSECEKPFARGSYLSFEDKYASGKREYPAKISEEISQKIKTVTEKVYKALNFNGIIRIDYFVKGQTVYLNEINSVPGSLAYYFFGESLTEFTNLLTQLIRAGERDFIKRKALERSYNSGILSGRGCKGVKRLR